MTVKNLAGVIVRRHAVAPLNETEHCSDKPILHILHTVHSDDDDDDVDVNGNTE